MLESRSPLTYAATVSKNGVTLTEARDFTLTQVAGDEKTLKKALGKLPKTVGKSIEQEAMTLLRVAPKQIWVLGGPVAAGEGLYVTPLSSGRTRFALDGPRARDVLAACALIDFHETRFKQSQFVLTGIHHAPVVIHCTGEHSFHVYALRTFALNVWEWLSDVMEGLQHD
jgi:methylglutamate dehydrogenase subunit D